MSEYQEQTQPQSQFPLNLSDYQTSDNFSFEQLTNYWHHMKLPELVRVYRLGLSKANTIKEHTICRNMRIVINKMFNDWRVIHQPVAGRTVLTVADDDPPLEPARKVYKNKGQKRRSSAEVAADPLAHEAKFNRPKYRRRMRMIERFGSLEEAAKYIVFDPNTLRQIKRVNPIKIERMKAGLDTPEHQAERDRLRQMRKTAATKRVYIRKVGYLPSST